jgi:PAS domain S-box-containing protein
MRPIQRKSEGQVRAPEVAERGGAELAEARLREYENVFEGVEEMIAVIDRDFRYQLANRAFLRHRSKERDEVVGRYIWEVVTPSVFEEIIRPNLEKSFAGDVVRFEMDYAYPELGQRRLLISYFPVAGAVRVERVVCILQDMTEFKHAQQALADAERKYREMFENAQEGIFQSTPDGRYLAANPALARMHGFDSPEELMRERTDISRDAYADPKRREAFKRLMESEGVVSGFEFQLTRNDGEQIWVSVNARVVRDALGRTMYYEGTALDITEQKRAQEKLQASEERYRDLVENSHELIGTHDLNGLILSANQAIASALDLPLDEIIGKKIQSFLAPEFAVRFDENMEFVRTHGGSHGLMIMITNSGERRIWDYYNSLRSEGVAKPIVRGIARDITEQRLSQKALRESEQRYRELFENSRDAIYVHDLGGRYISVNRAAEQLSGFERQEILGKHYSNFIAPRNLKNARESFCLKLDAPVETIYEAEVVCKNGHRIPVEISSRMIYRDGQAVGVQGIARDITERKRAQQTLQNYSRRLLEVQEAERQNLSRELHDEIGQALTAIRINLEWIRRSINVAPEALPRIDDSIEAVDDAVRRVRELALELRPSLLDDLGLASALRWYVDRFAVRTGISAQVVGDIQRTNHIPHEIETAAFRIVQEALTNVARHSFATRVSIDISQRNGELHLEVYDNGIGFHSDTILNGKSSATALGLRGMQERALAVNGDINISSQPRAGTHILLAVPLGSTSR